MIGWALRRIRGAEVEVPEPRERYVKQSGSKAIGYCLNKDCHEFCRGTFMFMTREGTMFKCASCNVRGTLKRSTLDTDDKGFDGYKTAIVHFAYSPPLGKYQYEAIVELDEMVGGNVLIIEDPLISTENRALKVAEMRLSAANAGDLSIDGHVDWVCISFDAPEEEWKRQLNAVELRGRTISRRLHGE